MKNFLKPKLGQPIYFITYQSCTLTSVGYLGKDSFIINDEYGYERCYQEWHYSDYNNCWFTSFEKAMEALKELSEFNPEEDEIVGEQLSETDGYWEVVWKE